MADQPTENTSTDKSLALSGATLASMQSGLSILTQIKGVLYDMSKNPLTATFAVYQLNRQLESVIGVLKRIRTESKEAGTGLKGMVNSQNVMMASSFVLGIAMSLKTLRQEINQTRLSLYAVKGSSMLGEEGFAAAFGFTQRTLDLQAKYGKEFVQMYMKTVNELGYRMRNENMTKERKEQFLEVVTGLSKATGADYSANLERLQDTFAPLGQTMEEALAQLDLLREMSERGDTAVGKLNETMDTSVRIMTDMGKTMGPKQAFQNLMQLNMLAKQMHLSPREMAEMYQRNSAMTAPGAEGVAARQHFAMFLPTNNPVIEKAFQPYKDRGIGRAEAMAQMQIDNPALLAAIIQQQARSLIPTTKEGKVDYGRLYTLQSQEAFNLRKPPGYSTENLVSLAMQPDIDLSKLAPAKSFDEKLSELANKGLPEFAKELDDLIEKAGTWQDALDAYIKKFKMGGPTQDILGTVGEGLTGIAGSAGGAAAAAVAWNMVKKWMGKAPEVAGKVAETVTQTASKVTIPNALRYAEDASSTSTTAGAIKAAKVAEEVITKPGFLGRIGGYFGKVFGGALPGMELATGGTLSYPEYVKKLKAMGDSEFGFYEETPLTPEQQAAIKAKQNAADGQSGAQSQPVNVVVHNYIDGEYVAGIIQDATRRRDYVTPNAMNK